MVLQFEEEALPMMRRDMMRPAMRMPWKLFFAGSKFSAISRAVAVTS